MHGSNNRHRSTEHHSSTARQGNQQDVMTPLNSTTAGHIKKIGQRSHYPVITILTFAEKQTQGTAD